MEGCNREMKRKCIAKHNSSFNFVIVLKVKYKKGGRLSYFDN